MYENVVVCNGNPWCGYACARQTVYLYCVYRSLSIIEALIIFGLNGMIRDSVSVNNIESDNH